ncbi:acyl-CoA dehydrogenase family protein [Paraburkholderia sp. MM6662-R1]|uniref:acyl-CoA dehydrogenase family protein n=1 Tax=Paraburkholderia sp. MM6662-R1 TaxID=2991066 RepID=UPI003D1CFE21
MDFVFTDDEEAMRASVQAFIAEHITDEVRKELADAHAGMGKGPQLRALQEEIYRRGWLAISWPKEYGGQGGATVTQYIVEEEFVRACDMRVGGGGTGGPAILASGTEQQKREYLPAASQLQITFCQGYSEPHCGTDLAALRCRAIRKGDKYVINGQKIYTTNAQNATHIFLLARTNPDSRRQAGLSVFLVPMNTPGITVRPLWTIQNDPKAPPNTTYGESRTNEVFFDDVEVPASCLLGEEGDGWSVTQRGLNLDRVGAWRYLMSVRRTEDIVNLLKSGDDRVAGLRNDPAVRDKIADLWTEAQMCRLMTMRSISISSRGGKFVSEGAAEKVTGPEHGVRATEAISQILGPYAEQLSSSPEAIESGVYAHNLQGAFQSTVNHGSVQVMRDQIARKGLGMPKPPSAAKPRRDVASV